MKNYVYHIRIFFQRFLLLLVIFTISRFLFYLFNHNYFSEVGFFELIKILIAGIRFDISALFYFNILFILLSLIPGTFKNLKQYQKITIWVFMIINILLLATNFVDTKFFEFENKRLTSDNFSSVWLGEDFRTLLPQFIKDYWYLIVLWICLSFMLYKFYPKYVRNDLRIEKFRFKTLLIQIIIFIFLMGLGLLGGRGGVQLKPLRIIHASKYTSARNVPLVLNSPFTIMKSFGRKAIKPKKYFDKETLDTIYTPVQRVSSKLNEDRPNVVVFILESFSKEYIGALNNGSGYTPFLDSLIKEGMVFPNSFANGKRSIEAITSIAAGIPSLQTSPFITSNYSSNTIKGLPEILNNLGYHTSFFHGGKNGTMNFDSFANMAGYSSYFGMNEFDNEAFFDGKWGIFDEEFFYFWADNLNSFEKPFFSTIFTLTSHHPYPIPDKYKGKFPKGNLDVHETIGYTDFAIEQFFNRVKNEKWYNNTLFIFVADHTAQAEKKQYNNNLGMYSIPILLYHPNDSTISGEKSVIAQQTDIFPTILDYIGYEDQFVCYGNSLLNDSTNHFSINYINGIYQLIEDNYVIQFDGQKTIAIFNYNNDIFLKNNLVKDKSNYIHLENRIKAIIQSYQERMAQNKLVLK